MTEQEKQWFGKLVEIRTYLASALELSAASGVKDATVEKYSDEAHFIYELLQNADDAGAEKAEFKLSREGLYFIHNGKTHFTISQPDTLDDKEIEKRDKSQCTTNTCSLKSAASPVVSFRDHLCIHLLSSE